MCSMYENIWPNVTKWKSTEISINFSIKTINKIKDAINKIIGNLALSFNWLIAKIIKMIVIIGSIEYKIERIPLPKGSDKNKYSVNSNDWLFQ